MTKRTACGQGDLAQRQEERKAERVRGLELAGQNAFNAGTEHLRRVGRHDEGKGHRRGNPGRQADADEGQGIVDQDEHDQHRHGAEDVRCIRLPSSGTVLAHRGEQEADQQADRYADADAEKPEQQRVEEAARMSAGKADTKTCPLKNVSSSVMAFPDLMALGVQSSQCSKQTYRRQAGTLSSIPRSAFLRPPSAVATRADGVSIRPSAAVPRSQSRARRRIRAEPLLVNGGQRAVLFSSR